MTVREQADWQIFDQVGQRKYVSQSERLRFLEIADRQPIEIRTLCYLLAYTGCRISEALALEYFHIDQDRSAVIFKTLKRRKRHFRCVPVPTFLIQSLLELNERGQSSLWIVHRATAWRWIKQVMADAKIEGPMATCKGLRHGFGVWAATQSVPPNLIQRWMGHASGTTTAIYLNVVGSEERMFAERMWHLAKLKLAA